MSPPPLDQSDEQTPPIFFSIVSANYLAYAITLMQSLREHHPDSPRYVIFTDEGVVDLGSESELFTLVSARDVGVPNFEHFAFRYSIIELNTAIKPFAMGWLAKRYPSRALAYIDPDILVVSPLEQVFKATSEGALAVLTPHITSPITDDKYPDEMTFLRVGVYNLGFIALGPHPARDGFLRWWCGRLEFGASSAPESGLFTDQKWIDLLPSLFPDVVVLRDPGYNLAYWNLANRPVSLVGDDLYVNGARVSFVHFSGVDPRRPDQFSKYQNRFTSKTIGALLPLYAKYLDLLARNGHAEYSRIPYAWARLADSSEITPAMRAVFRERFDIGRPKAVPDPFALPRRAFLDSPPLGVRLKRFAVRLYPRLRGIRALRFLLNRLSPEARWALRRYFMTIALPTTASRGLRVRAEGTALAGSRLAANVIGHLRGEFGVGEAARSVARSAEHAGVEVALLDLDAGASGRQEDNTIARATGGTALHGINVLCVNADQVEALVALLGQDLTTGRYSVGYWFWELSRFPTAWTSAFEYLDEIWVASDFVRESISAATAKPVRKVRVSVEPSVTGDANRSQFAIPDDRYVFLYSFDFRSYISRKNPEAAVHAFRSAFPVTDDRAILVLKSTNGASSPVALRRLQREISSDPRIRLIDGFMSRDEIQRLQRVADCYVSLHRSEGFGLGLAESMYLGKPVVGTAYSGNLEFMDPSNSCLVGYRLTSVRPGEYPHHSGQVWADPDLDHAVYYLRRLVDDPQFGIEIGQRARAHMQLEFSRAAVGSTIVAELQRITQL